MAKIAEVQEVSLRLLKPYENNAKIHGKDQIEKLKKSIEEFGFLNPCLIDRDYNLIAGHGRVMAAQKLGWESVPCVFVEGLTEEQRKAYILADNRLAELATWDDVIVQNELAGLLDVGFDIELTGFELEETKTKKTLEKIEEDMAAETGLPESHIYIYALTAFGEAAEKIVMAKLPQDVADVLLQAVETRPISEIAEKLVEGVRNV